MKYEDFINSTKYRKKYDEIIPIGFDCGLTFAVKALFWRQHSYPLDWGRVVEESDKIGFRRKVEFLCTNFKDFINESDLYIANDNHDIDEDKNMVIYNKFNGMHFSHDFPKGKTIAESYPEVRAKYNRRIKRLMDLINSDKKVCIVFYAAVSQLPLSEIMYSTEMFYKIFPRRNVDFLILQNNLDIGDEVVYEELSDNVRRVSFFDELKSDGFALKFGIKKAKMILNATIKYSGIIIISPKNLNSFYRVDDIIMNPTHGFKGMISFGPYIPLDSGNHAIVVDYDLTDNYRAFVDVVCNEGKIIIIPKIELPHDTNKFRLEFNLEKNIGDLEVRFYCEPMEKVDENNKFQLFGIHID